MNDLTPYAARFDEAYTNYADARYGEMLKLIERYDQPELFQLLESSQFQTLMALIEPLIEIKNYKSQTPFPSEILATIACIAKIRTTPVSSDDPFANHTDSFVELVGIQGFQLPTVSAVFHFCHPDHFPIVDKNVEAACEILWSKYRTDFGGLDLPQLPNFQARAQAKLEKYRLFMHFLSRICDLQRHYTESANYRYIDKALMVMGGEELRNKSKKKPAAQNQGKVKIMKP